MIYKGKELEPWRGRQVSPRFKDLSGEQFGNWFVICRAPSVKQTTKFWCECSCGTIKDVYSTHLTRGYSRGCLRCANQKLSKGLVDCVGEIPRSFWKEFMRRASGEKARTSRRNLKFNLTLEEMWALYLKQDRKCALSGLPIGFCIDVTLDSNGFKHHLIHTASIDRIDSNGDYEISNVQWVHKDVNRMKNIFDQGYFIDICRRIVDRIGG